MTFLDDEQAVGVIASGLFVVLVIDVWPLSAVWLFLVALATIVLALEDRPPFTPPGSAAIEALGEDGKASG